MKTQYVETTLAQNNALDTQWRFHLYDYVNVNIFGCAITVRSALRITEPVLKTVSYNIMVLFVKLTVTVSYHTMQLMRPLNLYK